MSSNEEPKLNYDEPNLGIKTSPSPWIPHIPALITFVLGIGGGIVVSYINFRRFGKERVDTVFPLGIIASISLVITFLVPDSIPSLIRYLVIALIFFVTQKNEFDKWQSYHQGIEPDKWWTAIGWGFLGLIIHGTIITLIFMFFDIPASLQPRNLRPLQ
jgi:uncharacterized membrane protein YfcA